MNVQLLIDSVVRQTTVLLAQLATSGGARAPVSHIANQVFVELSRELSAQGVSRKVSADMFGMALRAYQRKLRRLQESSTDAGQTLWKAVLDYVAKHETIARDQVLQRFSRDDETQVRAVLHDLNESQLVFASGSGAETSYRAATDAELSQLRQRASGAGLDELLWAFVYREGPVAREELGKRVRIGASELDASLARLLSAGRVRELDGGALHANDLLVPLDAASGWEAAVFDHFQAMVQTITQRLALRADDARAQANDVIGGSTYSFDVWEKHPLAGEVYGLLARFRREHSALRKRVDDYNREHALPADYEQVVFYGGQCVLERGREVDMPAKQLSALCVDGDE